MNLYEFREALRSEATDENEKLKKELQNLKKQYCKEIKRLRAELELYQDDCRVLSNRCFALTGLASGIDFMCYHCKLNGYHCEHVKTIDDKIAFEERNGAC